MHTTTFIEENEVINFHYNGDYSGEILIDRGKKGRFELPFAAFKLLVAEYIREQKISKLEDATIEELLQVGEIK